MSGLRFRILPGTAALEREGGVCMAGINSPAAGQDVPRLFGHNAPAAGESAVP